MEHEKTIENTGKETEAAADGKISGGDAVLRSLIEEGVDTIFGYPGGQIIPLYDRLMDYEDSITHILARHEQGAAHAAQAYSQATGRVGVCLATSGPGATNLITGIANAYLDSIPAVFITGQVTSGVIGSDAFQEADIIGISMPVTKWNCQVKKAEDIPGAIAKAFYIARTGRPGPTLVDIPKDVQSEMIDFEYRKCNYIRSYNPRLPIKTKAIEAAAIMINHSERPLILAGHGVLLSGAEKELLEFAEKTGIPVALTLMGLSAFPSDHRLYAGMLGMHGNYAPNMLTNHADLLIAIGTRFSDRITGNLKKYATQASKIHIEIDNAEINKNVPVDIEIHNDAKEALERLIPLVKPKQTEAWVREFRILDKIEYEEVIKDATTPTGGDIRMGEVVKTVSDITAGDAIIVTDVGQNQMYAARYYRFIQPNSLITSGGMGTMGFGLPAAMGAKLGRPEKEVIVFLGDGGFQMTMQELGTIMQYSIPVKMVILNNSFLGMVRQWQQLFFNQRYSATPMVNPDFIMLAKAFGIPAVRIDKRADIKTSVQEMIDAKGPYLLEVKVENQGNVFPMIPPGAGIADLRLK